MAAAPRRWSVLRRPRADDRPTAWLVVGLGNPGPRYKGTRHNIGREVVEALATAWAAPLQNVKFDARHAHAVVADSRVLLVAPTTYMNESGRAVAPLARFFRVPPAAVLLVYDDLDLPLGTLRIRPGGGAGGHNGVASVITSLGTTAVPRLRLGIGRPPLEWDPVDHVLARFSAAERDAADDAVARAAEAIGRIVRDGLDSAMNAYN
jgi:peptidyl-tRNA hydrolase, PTH1 family